MVRDDIRPRWEPDTIGTGRSIGMGPHSYAARYRHRVSARFRQLHARRIIHYWDRHGTAPLPDISDPHEDWGISGLRLHEPYPRTYWGYDPGPPFTAIHWGDERLTAGGVMGTADTDSRLRDGDADPDTDSATDTGHKDGGEDTGSAGDGNSEGATTSVWIDGLSWNADRQVRLGNYDPSTGSYTYTVTYVPNPDTGGDVPTDIEDIRNDTRWDDDHNQWMQARHNHIAAYLADRVLGSDVEGD